MRTAFFLGSVAFVLSLAASAGAQTPPTPTAPTAAPSPTAPTGTFAPEAPPAEPAAPTPPATEPAPDAPAVPAATAEPTPPLPPPAAEPPPPPEAPPPSARIPPRSERTLYANFSALLALYARAAVYEVERGNQYEQVLGGGGYELVGMLGSAKDGFAFGGGASFVYVGKTDYTWESETLESYHPSVWALSVGPAVDYHPGRRFHIGGLVGLSLEGVPSFEPLPRKRERVPGIGSAIWLGFEWAVSDEWNLGVCMTGHLNQAFDRDLKVARDRNNSEVSISLGLGVNVSRF